MEEIVSKVDCHAGTDNDNGQKMKSFQKMLVNFENGQKRIQNFLNENKIYLVFPCIEREVYAVRLVQLTTVLDLKDRIFFQDQYCNTWYAEDFGRFYLNQADAFRKAFELMRQSSICEGKSDEETIKIAEEKNMLYNEPINNENKIKLLKELFKLSIASLSGEDPKEVQL